MHTLYGLGSFTSEHEDLNLLICMILWGFLGQVTSAPFLGVTSGRLLEEVFNLELSPNLLDSYKEKHEVMSK